MNGKQVIFLASITLIAIVAVGLVTASSLSNQKTDKLNVVVTFYPLAFMAQEIGGTQVQITQLISDNTEIHSWEPSASHIVAAEDADIIVYNGAGLDNWMEDDILPALSDRKTRVVVETTLNLELLSGGEHTDKAGEDEHNRGVYDPHTWVSPYMANMQAEKIYEALVKVDPQHESYYSQQWANLRGRFEQLDNDYTTWLSNAEKNIIFVSHEAFGYLAHRYGFEQHGVIGLSADEQPSATTLANLITEMKEHETYTVYVDPVYSTEYVQTIKSEVQTQTGQSVNILELYLMLGSKDGMDLLEQMQVNLGNLKVGLKATK